MFAQELLSAAQNGDRDAQQTLLIENSRLIWGVVRHYLKKGIEAEDLFQLGAIGFLKAIAGFNEGYGTQFSTYAVPKIAGEIRRFLRDDGPVKVSRSLKEQAYSVSKAREKLTTFLGREPKLSELCRETGLDEEKILECEQAVHFPESLWQDDEGEHLSPIDTLIGDNFEETAVESAALEEVLCKLPAEEQQLIRLRYFHGLTQQATAKLMGFSQVQVSRKEKRILTKLRDALEA